MERPPSARDLEEVWPQDPAPPQRADHLRPSPKKENSTHVSESASIKSDSREESISKDEQPKTKRRLNTAGGLVIVLAALGIVFVCGWFLTHILNAPIRVMTWTEPGPDGITPSKDSTVVVLLIVTVVVFLLQLVLFAVLLAGLVYSSKLLLCSWASLSPILFGAVAAVDIVTVYKYRSSLLLADQFEAGLILGLYLTAITLGYLITFGACIVLTRSRRNQDEVQEAT